MNHYAFRLTYGEHMPKLHLAKTQAIQEALVSGYIFELLVLQCYLSNSAVNLGEMSHLGAWLYTRLEGVKSHLSAWLGTWQEDVKSHLGAWLGTQLDDVKSHLGTWLGTQLEGVNVLLV